eukprot:TRINITY_DN44074_c0_g1_i1.p1 TRINITY_DN44074_c0_g1~~TRINITY_DN44074_c0_g1_i1.p1  ORF type:complete len:269 (+),score=67.37 TRINITY_DN44074_c0_g1_i1:55-861(+)
MAAAAVASAPRTEDAPPLSASVGAGGAAAASFTVSNLKDVFQSDAGAALLERVYHELLEVNFPIADELDDLEDIKKNLAAVPNDRLPELNVLVARRGEDLVGCLYFEYYPEGNLALVSYVCVAPTFRRSGVCRRLFADAEGMLKTRAAAGGREMCPIFAETHAADVEDGVMDAAQRQVALASLGFRCLQFSYTQPPLSRSHEPCGGLRLLVKDQDTVPAAWILAYLDDFAGSVLDYDGSWKSEAYYKEQVAELARIGSTVPATDKRPW